MARVAEGTAIAILFLFGIVAASQLGGNSGRGDGCSLSVARGPELSDFRAQGVHIRLQEN